MKTTIITEEKNTQENNVKYPRLWRAKWTDTVWLETELRAVVIATQTPVFSIGDSLSGGEAHHWPAHAYEQITTPITIRFEP